VSSAWLDCYRMLGSVDDADDPAAFEIVLCDAARDTRPPWA
jgi:hypothetical protein